MVQFPLDTIAAMAQFQDTVPC